MNLLLGSRKTFWNQKSNQYDKVSAEDLLQLTHFGLGYKRSLDQFIAYTGIDTRSRMVFEDRCKRLSWVPFALDADPATDESDPWGLAPERLVSSAVAPGSGGAVATSLNRHSVAFNTLIHGSPLPLLSEGKKKHVSSVYVTDKQQRDALIQQMQQKAAADAAEASGGEVVVPESEPETLPPAPPSPVVVLWRSGLGWWFDDWMTLVQTLLMLTLPRQVGTKENTLKIIKIMLLLFPVVLCMIVGSLSVLGDDGSDEADEAEGSGEENRLQSRGDEDDEERERDPEEGGLYGAPRKGHRGQTKKSVVASTPASGKKKQASAPATPVKRLSPKASRDR
jgi:hypothetical protein